MVSLFFEFLVVVVVILSGVVCYTRTRKKLRNRRQPPGPFAWPILGNTREFHALSSKLGGQHKALVEFSKRYKSPIIRLKLGIGVVIVANGSESILSVLNNEKFDGRPWNYFIKLRNMGMKKGITMNDGDDWWTLRTWFVKSMRSVGFARREMSQFLNDEMLRTLRNIGDGGVIEIKPTIASIVINVLWTFVTNKKFDEERLQYFTKLMDSRAELFDMTGGLLSAYPWLRHIAPDYSGYNVMLALNRDFKTILLETIEEHRANFVTGSETDLIDMFLNEMRSGKPGFDDDQLLIMLLDILIAGLMNISVTTLDFLFLNMLINPQSQRRLQEEIDRVIGRDRLPEVGDRTKMPYAEAVILESQRIAPVIPIIGPRRVLQDTELLDYDLPKNSIVIMNLHSIFSDPDIYPEPEKFKPERFIKDGKRIKDDNLIFFGKGHRQCPGMSLAQSALFLVLTGIMQQYELQPVPGQKIPSLKVRMGITLAPEPYKVFLKPRNTSSIRKNSEHT